MRGSARPPLTDEELGKLIEAAVERQLQARPKGSIGWPPPGLPRVGGKKGERMKPKKVGAQRAKGWGIGARGEDEPASKTRLRRAMRKGIRWSKVALLARRITPMEE